MDYAYAQEAWLDTEAKKGGCSYLIIEQVRGLPAPGLFIQACLTKLKI